jgi:dihydrofolate reductase
MASIDVIVMGRHTFEQVLTFDPWPYGTTAVYVMSRAPVSIPVALAKTVHNHPRSAASLVALLGQQ